MKIFNSYKRLILVFLSLIMLLFPLINTTAANEAINSAVLFTIAPPIWLASNALSFSQSFNCSWDNLQDCIPNAIITAFSKMISTTVVSFMSIAEKFLKAAIDPTAYLGYGFTPSDNPYISIGWEVIKNLANAILVLGLVVIAISIILGSQENKAKKLLINFIIIALLINFTPVICGFIIDGSNIVTASMLTNGISSSYSANIGNLFISINKMSDVSVAERFAYIFIVSIFCIFAIIIFFLYTILFFARMLILWILVIISPLAFATFIIKGLPQSKYIKKMFPSVAYWDDWWESFIQWCVIGIPAGFSLYISDKILIEIGNKLGTAPTDIFSTLIAYLIPFIFLIVGFFITISTGTEAANKLSSELTGYGKKGLGFLGATGAGLAGGAIGAGVGAGKWAIRDKAKDDPDKPPMLGEYLGAGWKEGKESIQKDGLIGGAMNASNKAIGGVAGGIIGAGKWAKRDKDSLNLLSSIRREGEAGWDKGGLKTVTEATGKTLGTMIGAGGGALVGTEEGLKTIIKGGTADDAYKALKKEINEGMEKTSKAGGTIAYAIGGGAVRTMAKGIKTVSNDMIGEISKIKEEKRITKKEWKKLEEEEKGKEEKEEKEESKKS